MFTKKWSLGITLNSDHLFKFYCFQSVISNVPECILIIFKLLLNTYKALKGLVPDYFSTLLTVYKPARSLRSSAAKNLSVPKSRTTAYGDRSFACALPKLRNQLPQHIKLSETLESFKSRLKTHLFKIAFDI